jgi:hypothetical protein
LDRSRSSATPYEVLAELSVRMTGKIADEDLLKRMAQLLAEGTGAVRADVWLRSGDVFRDSAIWPADAVCMPPVEAPSAAEPHVPAVDQVRVVMHQGEVLGALSLRKRPGERLTPAEDRMLGDLAAQAGLVLRNLSLTEPSSWATGSRPPKPTNRTAGNTGSSRKTPSKRICVGRRAERAVRVARFCFRDLRCGRELSYSRGRSAGTET